jgi:hypothetical protein
MGAPRRNPAPEDAAKAALEHLKQAESKLLAAVQPGSHPNNTILSAHRFLREAISALSKAV